MHFSKTGIVSSFVSLALAANHIPVTIENLDPDFDIKCNGVTVTGRDVYNSVAWGMSLNLNNEQLESSTKKYRYPSYYGNSDKLEWISKECDQDPSAARQHMPVKKGGYFEQGGIPGPYRSVYWYDYDQDVAGHPKAYYCGTIYHINEKEFDGCDVRKR